MSTLHQVAESAVRRDLHRATGLLRRAERLSSERRAELTQHLVWMMSLTESGDPRVAAYAIELRRNAGAFGRTGERPERELLLAAVNRFLTAVSRIERWTSPAAVWGLEAHLPWLLDGLATHAGPGLHFRQHGSRDDARSRAAAYQRTRSRLWGTLALVHAIH